MTSLEPIQGLDDKVLVQICIIVDDADKYARIVKASGAKVD